MGASLAVLTAEGEITVVLPEDEVELAENTSSAKLIPYHPAGLNSLSTPTDRLKQSLDDALKKLGLRRANIGVQLGQGMQPSTYAAANEFRSTVPALLKELQPGATCTGCDDLLEEMKAVKTTQELALMQHACRVAVAGFDRAAAAIQPGRREAEIAAELQSAFDTAPAAKGLQRSYGFFFCMSGPNSAKASGAFARTRERVVEEGDLVMIHANTCADGYWTDITRTYTAGKTTERQKDIHAAVDKARAAALAAIRPNTPASEVDHAARAVMKQHGMGEAFKHSTGHGVGFAAANPNGRPRIHPLSPDILEAGMTFNVEPAAYFDGYGGVRHCDLVAVTETGVTVLTDF
jgi:Xaa-Pro aminopeptidase